MSTFDQAKEVIPGGVNSPVRSFKGLGTAPLFMTKGQGAHIYDETGKSYIDYIGSWGPLILGHRDPDVEQAVLQAVQKGLSFGAPCPDEVALAKLVCDTVDSIEQIRFVNSGTEATMSALRVARAATGRNKVIKFKGCYHGHADPFLVQAGSGAQTLGIPNSPGVPNATVHDTLLASYNDLKDVEQLLDQHQGQVAALIVEPVAGNMNLVLPKPGFLQGLRDLCDAHDVVLIFDEVMTGFRIGLSGAQGYYGVKPDLTTFGKIIGGGMPVGAFGGRRNLMQWVAPAGPVYQAGTLAGNPVAMAAGLATLKKISQPGFDHAIAQKSQRLVEGLKEAADKNGVTHFQTQALGGMFGFYFVAPNNPLSSFDHINKGDADLFKQFFNFMLEQGVYWAPARFEAGFISIAHTEALIDQTIEKADLFFATKMK